MHKFSLALGVIIAITAMMAIPTTNVHVAKAYSCSSGSSTAHTPSSSSSVSGAKGGWSTSSSSSSSTTTGFGTAIGPNVSVLLGGNNPGISGLQAKVALSQVAPAVASQHGVIVTSQSQPGRCH